VNAVGSPGGLRGSLQARGAGSLPGFRMRGGDVSRVEGFSDAVFGFALTLLVVSLEVPRTFDDLLLAMRGLPAFAVTFAILIWVWFKHYVFFRRYGLADTWTITLNAFLLFVVLFYVFPLKFVFAVVFDLFTGAGGTVRLAGGEVVPRIRLEQVDLLMMIYGAGFIAVALIFALLYRHALGRRTELDLSGLEVFDTRSEIRRNLLLAGVGVLSLTIAALGGKGLAGFVYFLIGVVEWIHAARTERRRRRLLEAAEPVVEGR
jgi:uncharacterized membrane protein